MIVFPELSLTGYQPRLAEVLALQAEDERLDVFQWLSDRFGMLIAVGAPIRKAGGNRIGMLVFQPQAPRTLYCKQRLHPDEFAFFLPGAGQSLFTRGESVLAPAICYESLQAEHARQAAQAGAQVYFTSVAKSQRGVDAAYAHCPLIAREHGMTVLMANCVGPADDYVAAGQSGVWNAEGALLIGADAVSEVLVCMTWAAARANWWSWPVRDLSASGHSRLSSAVPTSRQDPLRCALSSPTTIKT